MGRQISRDSEYQTRSGGFFIARKIPLANNHASR
jgi:hypothetical protein